MRIAIIGAGYVGLTSAVCLAEIGHTVLCVEKDKEKLNQLEKGVSPIREKDMDNYIERQMGQKRLFFMSDIRYAVNESDVVMIAVGTPSLPDGSADLSQVYEATQQIGENLNHYTVVIIKSTVPVGTLLQVSRIIADYYKEAFDVVSCPEFLREGTAIEDMLHGDRIVIGTSSEKAGNIVHRLYEPFGITIMHTDAHSAEMIKYASNAFLAMRVSFINEIANICNHVGADVWQVAKGMGYDKRIGHDYLRPGLGFGGPCLPKDIRALAHAAKMVGYEPELLNGVISVNQRQPGLMVDQWLTEYRRLYDQLPETAVVIGLAFKPGTEDTRESPALEVVKELERRGVRVRGVRIPLDV